MKKFNFIFLLLLVVNLYSEIRYVSKTGSSTPPYTTPATASDSIQKCIQLSNAEDTIIVYQGLYQEELTIYKRIYLLGSGADSTIIMYNSNFSVIYTEKGGEISGFKIHNTSLTADNGIFVKAPVGDTLRILDCIIFSKASCVAHSNGTMVVENCYTNGLSLVGSLAHDQNSSMELLNNIAYCTGGSNIHGTETKMINNIFYLQQGGFWLMTGYPHVVANNILINTRTPNNSFSMSFGMAGWGIKYYNNLVSGKFTEEGIGLNLNNELYNNLILYAAAGILPDPQAPSIIRYNAFWKVGMMFRGIQGDSTNKMLFPMFVDEAGGDFRLQKYSPLIDAGDPELLDVDGTRSDIGPLGGPYGRSYEYLDLAPRAPVTALPIMTSDSLTLRWQKNYETDLTGYRLYQDTVEQFVPFPDKLIYAGQDTSYTLARPDSGRNYYYIVTAIDSIVNESNPSQVIQLLLTSADENESEMISPEKTQLLGNYPNPFNPSTTIRYSIKERSYVKLYIYTLKGELLETRVNEEQSAGEYDYLFAPEITGTRDDLASGVYFYMLETKGMETGKIMRDTGKMLLIK